MRPGAEIVLASAARLYVPVMLLFGLTLFAVRAPGGGVGFVGGLALALALALYALVFGAAAVRAACPPFLMRLLLAAGTLAALAGAGAPGWRLSPQAIEAGLAIATAAGGSLIVAVLFGRAPTLRDADW